MGVQCTCVWGRMYHECVDEWVDEWMDKILQGHRFNAHAYHSLSEWIFESEISKCKYKMNQNSISTTIST